MFSSEVEIVEVPLLVISGYNESQQEHNSIDFISKHNNSSKAVWGPLSLEPQAVSYFA